MAIPTGKLRPASGRIIARWLVAAAWLPIAAACNTKVGEARGAAVTEPTGFALAQTGGTCNVSIFCNGESTAPYDSIQTGEIAPHIQSQCAPGFACPYQAGESYRGPLCNGKARDEAVDVQKVPCHAVGSPAQP
jgi:hypothetical protein